MSTSAQADELEALKAQLEALQTRVSQLEAQPATSMPSGYSLLSIRDGGQSSVVAERQRDIIDPESGITISVLPAADVAPAAEISVSGEIRTLLVYDDQGFFDGDDDSDDEGEGHLDVQVRGRIVIQGKVDTAVGEVGARVRFQGGDPFDTHSRGDLARMNQAYGWWKFAPNWQLIAGYWDTTAAIQAGVDWDFTVGRTAGPSNKNVEQMRLVYGTEGPFSFAIAVEDTDDAFTKIGHGRGGDSCIFQNPDEPIITTDDINCIRVDSVTDRGQFPAVAGYLMYNNDNLMFQLAGVYQNDEFGRDEDWGVGAGARVGLGDMFTITAAGVYAEGYNGWANNLVIGEDDHFWGASVGVIFNLAEATRIELGGGYEQVDAEHKQVGNLFGPGLSDNFFTVNQAFDQDVWTVTGGIYWDPVSQVTVGLQANYQDFNADSRALIFDEDNEDFEFAKLKGDNQPFQVRFGTWLRFP
jgi:hypothetical protein